jgi:hypothetical protein
VIEAYLTVAPRRLVTLVMERTRLAGEGLFS